MERLRCTWWTAAHQPPTFLVVSSCLPPVSGSWSFRVIVWTVSVVGVLLSRAHRLGIRYLTVFATKHWVSTCLGVSWRRTFFEILTRCTQRIRDILIMRYIKLHFTLLYFTVVRLYLPTFAKQDTAWHCVAVNRLALINAVALHWARLLLGWVTVCWQVNNLGM